MNLLQSVSLHRWSHFDFSKIITMTSIFEEIEICMYTEIFGFEELKFGKMVVLGQQGAVTQWDGILKRKVSWWDISASNFVHIWFLTQAVYDTILRSENCNTWGKAVTPQCPMFEKRGSPKHIFSSYIRALDDGCWVSDADIIIRCWE